MKNLGNKNLYIFPVLICLSLLAIALILFLSPKKGTGGSFVATGGAQGLFELPADKSGVKPKGHSSDLVQKYKNRAASDFLEEIREAVRKYPEASS
jgi:hypothetical protein